MNKRILIAVVGLGLIIFLIALSNQWMSSQLEQIEKSTAGPSVVSPAVTSKKLPSEAKIPVIDPENDPLKPMNQMQPQKEAASSDKILSASEPLKIFEGVEVDPILIQ